MVYGSRSWVDHCPGTIIQQMRPTSYVDMQVIRGAGHHVYADSRDKFNDLVLKACTYTDENCYLRRQSVTSADNKLDEDIDMQGSFQILHEPDDKPSLKQ